MNRSMQSIYTYIKETNTKCVSRGNVMQGLQQEVVQGAEGTSQLQDWYMESKDLEARRQIGELENGNSEE